MSLLVKRNGNLFPGLVSDLFDADLALRPSLFDFDRDLFKGLRASVPSVNITEDENSFKFELAAPGLDKKDFKVEADNGILTISSEKEKENTEENENYCRREFSYNSFSRSFQLPDNSLPDKIDAKYENGVLKLTLPKKEVSVAKPKKEIKVS
jgi:HSP20 family protein